MDGPARSGGAQPSQTAAEGGRTIYAGKVQGARGASRFMTSMPVYLTRRRQASRRGGRRGARSAPEPPPT